MTPLTRIACSTPERGWPPSLELVASFGQSRGLRNHGHTQLVTPLWIRDPGPAGQIDSKGSSLRLIAPIESCWL